MNPIEVALRCKCGALRGLASNVSKSHGIRIVCMCDDCQAFAHYLGAPEALDENGGTDIFQTAPQNLQITQGSENLKCMRLSKNGMIRWYAGCCNSAIANTLGSAKIPFAGTIHTFMDHASSGVSRDQALGLPLAYMHARFAVGNVLKEAHKSVPPRVMFRSIQFLLGGLIGRKHRPSPLFDLSTGKPRVEPYVLSRSERDELRKMCGPR